MIHILRRWAAPTLIVLLGLAMRLYKLDAQSAWVDETTSIVFSAMEPAELWKAFVSGAAHPPLHGYVLHAWFRVFGQSVIGARLPSAIFGALAIPMIFLLARYLFDRRTALIAAFLLAISHIALIYSQEARAYAMALFLVTSAAYLFLRAFREGRATFWWGSVACGALLVYTHYYGFLALAALCLFAFLYRKQQRLTSFQWAGGAVLFAALYMPWLTSGIIESARTSPTMTRMGRAFPIHWWTAPATTNWFNNGKVFGQDVPTPWWAFTLGAVLFTLPAALALKRRWIAGSAERQGIDLLIMLFAIPLAAVHLVGILHVAYFPRYLLFCAVPYYILVARGVAGMESKVFRGCAIALMTVFSGLSVWSYYTKPTKADYRSATSYIADRYRDGDCAMFPNNSSIGQPRYWLVYHPEISLRRIGIDQVPLSQKLACERVWLVQDFEVWTPPSLWKSITGAISSIEKSYALAADQSYLKIRVRLYVLPP